MRHRFDHPKNDRGVRYRNEKLVWNIYPLDSNRGDSLGKYQLAYPQETGQETGAKGKEGTSSDTTGAGLPQKYTKPAALQNGLYCQAPALLRD